MRNSRCATWVAASLLLPAVVHSAPRIALPNVTVGKHLQLPVSLTLDVVAPTDLAIKVTTTDPRRILLSAAPDRAGEASISVPVRAGSRLSREFFVQGLDSTGSVSYSAAADGVEAASATVTLGPSGVILARAGVPLSNLRTTTGLKAQIMVLTALLDSNHAFAEPQLVAGGHTVMGRITTSDPKVGGVAESFTIHGGAVSADLEFRPTGPGAATLAIVPPAGFETPTVFASVEALVIKPGMAIADSVAVGQNLQVQASVSLGEPAPQGGVTVELSSEKPAELLLSPSASEVGKGTISLRVPEGSVSASYYLQAIGNSGTVGVTASASGYRPRTGSIILARSGVVIGGPPGPPDEAELFHKEIADGPRGFLVRLSAGEATPVMVYSVQLDPATGRSADLTVQPLRAGVSLQVPLLNSNPAIGKLHASSLVIAAGTHTAATAFTPLSVGSTVISLSTPEGFTKSANATAMTVIVDK
jgi:hypothetical protein